MSTYLLVDKLDCLNCLGFGWKNEGRSKKSREGNPVLIPGFLDL